MYCTVYCAACAEPALYWRTPITGELDLFPGYESNRVYVLVNGTLGIREVRKEDEGLGTGGGADTYRCFALSTLGLAIAPVTLRVDGPPNRLPVVVVRGPANLTRRAGDTVRLPCVVGVYGPPAAAGAYAGRVSVDWRRNGTLLPREKLTVLANRTLLLKGVQPSDSGWYECAVSYESDANLYQSGGSLTVLAAGAVGSSSSAAGDEEARLPPRPSKPTIDNGGVLDRSVELVWNLQLQTPNALSEQQLRELSFHIEYYSPDWPVKVCARTRIRTRCFARVYELELNLKLKISGTYT